MEKVFAVINEQHSLLPDQERALNEAFPQGEFAFEQVKVPAQGWTLREMREIAEGLWKQSPAAIVFVSPIPFLIRLFARWEEADVEANPPAVYLFHNDRREKRELPDGRVIYTVPKDGWVLV